jgi:hypothetical protein
VCAKNVLMLNFGNSLVCVSVWVFADCVSVVPCCVCALCVCVAACVLGCVSAYADCVLVSVGVCVRMGVCMATLIRDDGMCVRADRRVDNTRKGLRTLIIALAWFVGVARGLAMCA